ncbi:hypothetical protein LEP1GSC199_0435 [Leptospira vanthielii serovar Holland str. Waz Holland = ATCC 700522]|uniref:Uncharacterized protein n=1 Tax=Leptospira vanthielii serovar Holland str. Waz Holland = ATCC 700522 TaxID=1218591 RepID=N1VZC5_9LEPT|nr:hypothetical protein LEP1GSC199_0435 [Leptospira vanthielii serovar Holland str. Waz Holland = ATCC 700522]
MFFANTPKGASSLLYLRKICFYLEQTFGRTREKKIWKFFRTSFRNFF